MGGKKRMKFVTNVTLNSTKLVEGKIHLARVSIPFKQGVLTNANLLVLTDDSKTVVPSSSKVTQHWPGGSIKWVILEWPADSNQQGNLLSIYIGSAEKQKLGLPVVEHFESKSLVSLNDYNAEINIKSGSLKIHGDEQVMLFPELNINNESLFLVCTGVTELHADDDSVMFAIDYAIDENGVRLDIKWLITFRTHYKAIENKIYIHNPKSACHDGGLWDLGDPASALIDSFKLIIKTLSNSKALSINNQLVSPTDNLELTQCGSGGENWQSKAHVNADGIVPFKTAGYRLVVDGEISHGKRANPQLVLQNKTQIVLEQFWQNFPSSIQITNDKTTIGFLADAGYQHELQGGEKKSYTFWFGSNGKLPVADVKVRGVLAQSYLSSTSAAFLIGECDKSQDEITRTIQLGLDGANNFFEKREIIDEYGWRNFGDIFADHETLGDSGKNVAISHYNNQYDPLFGFLSQFLISGDERWFELAEDLAKHVKEIDIYDTFDDRDEYNQGLFWHTDHYLDAETCSHRTFSKKHTHAYDGYTSGGGPGGQHCYTAGLTMHYFLTGDETSKSAVINMCHWVNFVFDGSNSLLAKLFGIKKSGAIGAKNFITGEYPLDRGTGHLVIAHLDAFSMTNKQCYLDKAFNIIRFTISPFDDISIRNFENIEATWFYTVFLQSVSRFLSEKEQLGQFDGDFEYARRALLLYVEWMANNEQPYLEQKDKLEFPNSTWVAQDLRKAFLFYAGSYFSFTHDYTEKGDEFYGYVGKELAKDNDKDTARILAILMQNYLAKSFFKGKCEVKSEIEDMIIKSRPTKNKYWAITQIVVKSLVQMSPKRELKWLALRSNQIAKLIGNK